MADKKDINGCLHSGEDGRFKSTNGATPAEEKRALELGIITYTPKPTELVENRNRLSTAKTVVSISGKDFQKSDRSIIDTVSEFFNNLDGKAQRQDFGDIALTRRGVKDFIGHSPSSLNIAAFMAVPKVIEKGAVIDYKTNYENTTHDRAVIAAPVEIDGTRDYVAVIIKRNKDTQRYYMHEVYSNKKTSSLFKTVSDTL